jgi:fluoroquinolone resistance protein
MYEDKIIEKTDYSVNYLPKGQYENCSFLNCVFSNSDLTDIHFVDCVFRDCDFSLAKLYNTLLNDINFFNCKLLGLRFDICNDSGLSFNFENCNLKLSSFYKLKLKKTFFKNCNLQEVDFSEADLTGAVFKNCDLQRAGFQNTNLEKADLSSSYNYSIDPEKNKLKKARFSSPGILGLLDKYDLVIV